MTNHTPETVTIQLTMGYLAIVNLQDADLANLNWRIHITKQDNKYAERSLKRTSEGKRPSESLHRVILSRMLNRPLLKGELVDHIDNDGLNNRRNNLRLSNKFTNQQNAGKKRNNKSGYKGVFKHRNKWESRIRVNGKRIPLGRFNSPEEAYEAYCKAAKELHGEFARYE